MPKDPVSKTKDVRAAVEQELGFDSGVDATHIAVRNIVGDVTLTGTVPSYPQYMEAAAAARRVAGVTGVHNQLEVALPEGDYRDDVKLATAANNALAANVTVPDTVEATAYDGDITLTGTVFLRHGCRGRKALAKRTKGRRGHDRVTDQVGAKHGDFHGWRPFPATSRASAPSRRGQVRSGSREILFEWLVPNSIGKKPGQDVVHDIPPRRDLEPDSERSKRGRP